MAMLNFQLHPNCLRWIALIPVTVMVWYCVVYLCFILCINSNVSPPLLIDVLIPVSAGISAIAVVLTATCFAPAAKTVIAWLTLFIGGSIAIQIAGLSILSISAVMSGLVTTIAVTAFLRKRHNVLR